MTQLVADGRGLWRLDEGEADLGMAWERVVLVMLHKIHDGERVVSVLELEDAFGELFVVTDAMAGFDEATRVAGAHLPTFAERFRRALDSETTLHDPLAIWTREGAGRTPPAS